MLSPADQWLIAVSVIVAILLFGLSFYLLVFYSHPDDVSLHLGPQLPTDLVPHARETSRTCPRSW